MVPLGVWLLVAMATYAYGQNQPIACPGVKLIRLNCFKSANPKTSMPKLIFTKKVNYRQWNSHIKSVVCECAAKRGKSNIFGIRNVGECRTGNLYAKEGTAPMKDCNTWNAAPCTSKTDCVGNGNTVFVYRVQPITTPKPGVTTKPTKPTTKSGKKGVTKKPTKISPENLMCFHYLIKMKLQKAPPGKPGSKAYSKMTCNVCKTIKTIYKCHPCFRSAHFIKSTTKNKETSATILLKFGCKGKHLKQLISKLTKGAIVSAECHDTSCPQTPLLAMTMPGCTMATACPSTPTCSPPVSYPCATQVSSPVPVSTVSCPGTCPSTCAPTCNPVCCRSKITRVRDQPKQNSAPLYDYSLEDGGHF